MYPVVILTISDKGSKGEREDQSGALLHQLVTPLPGKVIVYEVIPDEKEMIRDRIIALCDHTKAALIVTTGGTGVSPRDVTPEATMEAVERIIPGIGEVMRMEGYKKTPMAIISRGIAGVRKKTLIVNLPGSPRAVQENFELLLPVLRHTMDKITGDPNPCGRD